MRKMPGRRSDLHHGRNLKSHKVLTTVGKTILKSLPRHNPNSEIQWLSGKYPAILNISRTGRVALM